MRREDVRWMLALTAPRVIAMMRSYDKLLGIDAKMQARSSAVIVKALAKKSDLIRGELGAALAKAGLPAKSTPLNHLVMYAELSSLICSGVPRGSRQTYALLDERVPRERGKTMAREEAIATLARRYFASHGPALVQDFAWWSGLTVADAKVGVESVKAHLTSEVVAGKTFWRTSDVKAAPAAKSVAIHLLPNWDENVVAYRDHGVTLDDAAMKTLALPQRGLASNVISRDGRVIGVWRRTLAKREVVVELTLLAPLAKKEQPELDAAVERYGAFLGLPVRARVISRR